MSRDVSRHWLTIEDVIGLTGWSERTVRRYISAGRMRAERRPVVTSAGNVSTRVYVDPSSLAVPRGLDEPRPQPLAVAAPNELEVGEQIAAAATLEECLPLLTALQGSERTRALKIAAATFGVSVRTVRRHVAMYGREQADRRRRDAGKVRIPLEAYQLIVDAFARNEPTASARMIWKTCLRAAPSVMTYKQGGRVRTVSLRTVQRIRQQLLDHPTGRLLLADDDVYREFARTFSGRVTALHANELWQLDMTRCDVFVVDPERGDVFRPRVHAIIDIYSGVIPGLAFSRSEDQAQTDLALLRAISRKDGRYGHLWPEYGIPKALHTDNGSTYISAQTDRVLAGLGVRHVRSRPATSHTRGRIERFFGSLHLLERTLPGYAGTNASKRGAERLKRLERNTKRWLDTGHDPGRGERLLTIGEYERVVLAWLVGDYHQEVVDGMTRSQHFASTVPQSTLLQIPLEELLLLFHHREERVVDAAGRVRLSNRYWTVPDGSLILHAGRRVLCLTDQFALDPDRIIVAWEDRSGRVEVIGEAVPAPDISASIEADEHRRASRAAALEAIRQAKEQKSLTDPELRVETQLLRQLKVTSAAELPPAQRARLEAVNPLTPEEEIAADDELGQALLALQEQPLSGTADPMEIVRGYVEQSKRGEGKRHG